MIDRMPNHESSWKEIQGKSDLFRQYIRSILSSGKTLSLLECISAQTEVYIFSGIIRDFLLNHNEHRDIDIVICEKGNLRIPISMWRDLKIERNKFGGIKINCGRLNIDTWGLEDTWVFRNTGMKKKKYLLPATAFFNFSAIIFDYNNNKFIIHDKFYEFYETRTIDVVFPYNPYPSVCIINAFHYAYHYRFRIGYNMCKWIVGAYEPDMNFSFPQIRRFGNILYSENVIRRFVSACVERKRNSPPKVVFIKDTRGTVKLFYRIEFK